MYGRGEVGGGVTGGQDDAIALKGSSSQAHGIFDIQYLNSTATPTALTIKKLASCFSSSLSLSYSFRVPVIPLGISAACRKRRYSDQRQNEKKGEGRTTKMQLRIVARVPEMTLIAVFAIVHPNDSLKTDVKK